MDRRPLSSVCECPIFSAIIQSAKILSFFRPENYSFFICFRLLHFHIQVKGNSFAARLIVYSNTLEDSVYMISSDTLDCGLLAEIRRFLWLVCTFPISPMECLVWFLCNILAYQTLVALWCHLCPRVHRYIQELGSGWSCHRAHGETRCRITCQLIFSRYTSVLNFPLHFS